MTATFEDLELVYERLAKAIDEAGAEKSQLFLAKLALTLANVIADTDITMKSIDACLQDL